MAVFDMYMIFGLCYMMWAIPTSTRSALKKISGKESQYLLSRPGLGSDPSIGSDRDSGRDIASIAKILLA